MVIELSGVRFGLKSYAWFQNWTSASREFDLKSQVWFQTKIALHSVQLPINYIHFEISFEVPFFLSYNLQQGQLKIFPFMSHVHVIFSRIAIGYFGFFCFVIGCSKKCNYRHKTVQLQTQKSAINAANMMSRTNQIAGITTDFKMDIIKTVHVQMCMNKI